MSAQYRMKYYVGFYQCRYLYISYVGIELWSTLAGNRCNYNNYDHCRYFQIHRIYSLKEKFYIQQDQTQSLWKPFSTILTTYTKTYLESLCSSLTKTRITKAIINTRDQLSNVHLIILCAIFAENFATAARDGEMYFCGALIKRRK